MSSRVRVKLHASKERNVKTRTKPRGNLAEWVAAANKSYDEQEEEHRREEARRLEYPEYYEYEEQCRRRREYVAEVLGDDPEGEDTGQIRDLTALAEVFDDE